jgi:hypothetical protein
MQVASFAEALALKGMDCGAVMAEPLAITTLRSKSDQIEGLIAHIEDQLKEARTDLAHVNATLGCLRWTARLRRTSDPT